MKKRHKVVSRLLRWASAWAMLLNAIIGIVTLGYLSTSLPLDVVKYRCRYDYNHNRNREKQRNENE